MPQLLRAGPLALLYEGGEIRAIQQGEREVLSRVYAAVRDCNWGTVPMEIENETIFDGGDHFRVSFRVRHRQGEIAFDWDGEIIGESDATITFSFDGAAKTAFRRNRIGFCVLHPRTLAGVRLTLHHTDGIEAETAFPSHIAPRCPFQNLAAMTHPVAPGVEAKVSFSGDVFETEDQRNWIDASFKTYCTPLSRPFPVLIRAGERVRQSVRLELLGRLPELVATAPDPTVSLRIGEEPRSVLPPIGLMLSQDEAPLSTREIEYLKPLGLAHLRVDLSLHAADWEDKLGRADAEARALGCPLQIALFTGDAPDFELFIEALNRVKPEAASFLLFADKLRPASRQVFALARDKISVVYPTARFGAGTNANFAELNRNRPAMEEADFVVYSANPQVHAFDDDSILETCATLPDTVSSARCFSGSKSVAISPLTLKPRFNAVATGAPRKPEPGEWPDTADIRQTTLFGAAWTLSTLTHLAFCELDSLTLFETTGRRGVMESERAGRNAQPSAIFPLWHVLADLASVHGASAFPLISSDSRRVAGLAFFKDLKLRVLLANVSRTPQGIALEWPVPSAKVRILSEENFDFARHEPGVFRARQGAETPVKDGVLRFRLGSYAVVRVEARTRNAARR